MTIKKILAFSSIRSEYDLLSNLYKMFNNDPEIDFGIVLSGANLSKKFGNFQEIIEKDNLPIVARIESLLDYDTPSSRLKSASILLQNLFSIISQNNPNIIIYAGDREDVVMYALAAGYLQIPSIHFFGGDHTKDGNIDNPVRHAISKLSSIHFVSIDEHKQRLLKIGEPKNRIFVIGNPALDSFFDPKLPSIKSTIRKDFNLGIKNWKNYALLIFHPILGYEKFSGKYVAQIIECLIQKKINTFVSLPNSDPGYFDVMNTIKNFERKNNNQLYLYNNLNRRSFITLYKHAKFIIGNSSSGIVESATAKIPAINVGKRQIGRLAPENVLFVPQNKKQILEAIAKVIQPDFQKKVKSVVNPYGDGKSCKRAYDLIKILEFSKYLYKTEDPINE